MRQKGLQTSKAENKQEANIFAKFCGLAAV
jgi:hypothetical protein